MPDRPNILVILVDDMGFADIGCYGSEIATPNLDRLAAGGVRFSQMYNCARCCPTRASLLTGLYPHQAGVGLMVGNEGTPAYQGYLRDDCVTIAEALGAAGYSTFLSGKWHVGGPYGGNDPESWKRAGDPEHPIPVQRGFDRHYGMLGGAGSYFYPPYMIENETLIRPGGDDYYLTDAISDHAARMICESAGQPKPFFGYVAYTAPHWPLHARPEDVARYRGRYRVGWDELRCRRHEELKGLGILSRRWDISPRDDHAPPWSSVAEQDWEDLRMAVYAAQVDRMDQGVGRILAALDDMGIAEDTVVMFLADNGGCAEFLAEETDQAQPFRYNVPLPDGRAMHCGNTPRIEPGGPTTFASYDLPWANASNAPFRMFKHWVHEGGIATPLIVSRPGHVRPAIVHDVCHVMDIMPTCLELAGAACPAEFNGHAIQPLEGQSFADVLAGSPRPRDRRIFWEHHGNRAVRDDIWKLVAKQDGGWELYNMERDRTELNDLAAREPGRCRDLAAAWQIWADRIGVRWPKENA